MTSNATNLSTSGLRDWIIQRLTAVIIGLYTIFILGYLISHPNLNFNDWHTFMIHPFIQLLSALTLLSIVAHAWIGIWTVLTDYVNSYSIRLILEVLVILLLFSILMWGFEIIWFVQLRS